MDEHNRLNDMSTGLRRTQCFASAGGSWSGAMELDYEVVFAQDRLGLTLRSQSLEAVGGSSTPRTIVKSTSETAKRVHEGDVLISVNGQNVTELEFRDVRRLLKVSSRPIRLRFRSAPSLSSSCSVWSDGGTGDSDMAISDIANASCSTYSSSDHTTEEDDDVVFPAFVLPSPAEEVETDRDDLDSHYAVHSESFGDADSTRTTENSSVVTDITESDFKLSRQSSLFTAFLRKPFRRADGFELRGLEMRTGAVPSTPRVELALEAPCKAGLRVYWKEHPNALVSQVQFSRDRTMRVWKNWTGRTRRSNENERDLMTLIFGLEYGKSYVVRIRFEMTQPRFALSEWSCPSTPIVTIEPARLEAFRATHMRVTRN